MPRTKSTTKLSVAEIQEDFLRQASMRLLHVNNYFDSLIQQLQDSIDMAVNSLPNEAKNLTLGELMLLGDENCEEVASITVNVIPPSAKAVKKPSKRQTAVSTDDGYATETNSQQHRAKHVSRIDKAPSTSKRSVRKSRRSSSTSDSSQRPSLRSSSRAASSSRASKLQTPAASRNQAGYNPVTPKVKPNTPLSVLRRPRDGEMALSMQGSPLFVSAVPSRTANINVPLHNGNVISFLPHDGLRRSLIPNLDESTIRQLQTLKGHIEKVISNH